MKQKGKIIGIVGVSGSGKTTLGKNLKAAMACEFFEEDWKNNPFVFGQKSIGAHGLEVSIGFLVLRDKQYRDAQKQAQDGKLVLMDTVFEMTDLYSKALLDETEYNFFHQVYKKFATEIKPPDILIYLHAPYEILSERAQKRQLGVELEKTQISVEAFTATDKLIKQYVDSINQNQVVSVDVLTCDVRQNNYINELTKKVKGLL